MWVRFTDGYNWTPKADKRVSKYFPAGVWEVTRECFGAARDKGVARKATDEEIAAARAKKKGAAEPASKEEEGETDASRPAS